MDPSNRFEDSRVLLTGAGSGIGRATAARLVSEGAKVFAVDISPEGLAETRRTVSDSQRLLPHTADISQEDATVGAVEAAVAGMGGLDVLINVAGAHRTTPIAGLTVEDLRELYEVNLVGTALVCREGLRHLPDGTGVIVNVASTAAGHGNPYMTAYSASKGAVLGFSMSLAAEVVGRGIRVVTVSPGSVDTPLTAAVDPPEGLDFRYFARIRSPLGAAAPEQIAATLAYAASPDAGYLTGTDIRVDGGSHI